MTLLQFKIYIYQLLIWSFVQIINILPVKRKKIVFSNFNGRGWGDNPKYIALEIIRKKMPVDMVWLVGNMDENFPNGIRKVKFGGLRMRYELSTAKIIINNVKNDLPYRKKNSQFYIQTWHGGFPLKYIEGEVEKTLSIEYIAASKSDSSKIDLLLSSCSLDEAIMKNFFWYNGEIMKHGIPRNDLYFKTNENLKNKVRDNLHIPKGFNVALYAPTFRNDGKTTAYNLDAPNLLRNLESKTKSLWIVIIRLHPNVCRFSSLFKYGDKIIDGSHYPDPQELSVISDCLITDYSSMMYDFSIMKKPVFLFATDLKEYQQERGLRPLFFELPFALCQNNEELRRVIIDFNETEYQKNLTLFWSEKIQIYDNGHASEAVVQRIKDVLNGTFVK